MILVTTILGVITLLQPIQTHWLVSKVERLNLQINRTTPNKPDSDTSLTTDFVGALTEEYFEQEKRAKLDFAVKVMNPNQTIVPQDYYRLIINAKLEFLEESMGIFNYSVLDNNRPYFDCQVQMFQLATFQWGVIPREELKNLEIQVLRFLWIDNFDDGQTRLKNLTFTLKMSEENQIVFSSIFYYDDTLHNRGTTNENYNSSILRLIQSLLFFFLVILPAHTLISSIMVNFSSNVAINMQNGEVSEKLIFMYEHFYTFYKAHYFTLCSVLFIYNSYWSFGLVFVVIILEFSVSTFYAAILVFLVFEKISCFPKNPKASSGVLYNNFLGFISREVFGGWTGDPSDDFLKAQKTWFGLWASYMVVLACLFLPWLVSYSPWILSLAALYCVSLVHYENPSFMDFLSWVLFFGYYMVYFVLYINCFKAAAHTFSYLELFFPTLKKFLREQAWDLLLSLAVMTLAVGINFLFFKTKLRAYFVRFGYHSVKVFQHIEKTRAENLPGRLQVKSYVKNLLRISIKKMNKPVFVIPNMSKRLSILLDTQSFEVWNFEPFDTDSLETNKIFELNKETERFPVTLIESVFMNGKHKKSLVAVLFEQKNKLIPCLTIIDLQKKKVISKVKIFNYGFNFDKLSNILFFQQRRTVLHISQKREFSLFFITNINTVWWHRLSTSRKIRNKLTQIVFNVSVKFVF